MRNPVKTAGAKIKTAVDDAKKVEQEAEAGIGRALSNIHARIDDLAAKALTPEHLMLFTALAFVAGFILGRLR